MDKKGQKKNQHKYNLAKDRCVTFIYQTFLGGKGLDRILTHSFAHSFLFAVKLDIFLRLFLQLSLCKNVAMSTLAGQSTSLLMWDL